MTKEDKNARSSKRKGYPFLIVFGAVALVFGLSFVPWSELTGGFMKDFNLLSDLFPGSVKVTAEEQLDPELEAALVEEDSTEQVIAEGPSLGINITTTTDGTETISLHQVAEPKEPVDNRAPDGTVIFEDYTVDSSGLKNLKRAMTQASYRPVRIAVIGDSYIEGDIFTMNVREMLQDRFGGAGVGYVPASSELVSFRTSVTQKCNGWTKHEIRKNTRDGMKTLPGEYFTASGTASASYKGTKALSHLDSWNRTSVMAVAPQGGSVTLTIDGATETLELPEEDLVRTLTIDGATTSASLSATNGVEILGVFLNNSDGICVDNMSLRGNSGQTHRKLSVERAEQMRKDIDYDLIVVEYGINALSSQQSDYSGYKKLMMQTISRLRECYPNADILMMGIGDRGQKVGSDVKSVPTSANMVTAQRDAARQTGVLFWDTREAMGGPDAVLKWRADGYINPDYIHLNAKGGNALAKLFVDALLRAL